MYDSKMKILPKKNSQVLQITYGNPKKKKKKKRAYRGDGDETNLSSRLEGERAQVRGTERRVRGFGVWEGL